MAAAKRIQLFYDVISPYSWIGFETLCRYRTCWNIKLDLCPFYLAGIMGGSNNRPPGTLPAKGKYMSTDLLRLNEYYNIPIKPPSDLMEVMMVKGSLKAQRFLVATKSICPDQLEEVSRQFSMRIWSRDEDITEDSSLRAAGKDGGLSQENIDKMMELINTADIKEQLKQTTQEALDLGAFGAPFIVADTEGGKKETFFGSDRMELLAFVIGEKWLGPLPEMKASL